MKKFILTIDWDKSELEIMFTDYFESLLLDGDIEELPSYVLEEIKGD